MDAKLTAWAFLAAGLSGCSLIVDVEGCGDEHDCAPGEACAAGRCLAVGPEPPPDAARLDRAPPPDAALRRDALVSLADATPRIALRDAALPDAAAPDARAPAMCADTDGDGFGQGCPRGPDCREGDAAAHPGALERCNGQDDDCDGATDELLVAPPCAQNAGVCAGLVQRCGGAAGWIPCTAADYGVRPGYVAVEDASRCDGLDNDCDAAFDEACPCVAGARQPCSGDVGECAPGLQICDDNRFGPCQGAVGPIAELCNGRDDDCDGNVDEALGQPCGGGAGACRPGWQICHDGAWSVCDGQVAAAPESCNGIDDDCDGTIDDDVSEACGSPAVGACHPGTRVCAGGDWGPCDGAAGPSPEACNDIDDDCDGHVDEEISEACGDAEVGACRPGVRVCADGQWGSCDGGGGPSDEDCNGVDDDCDGNTDEALSRPCGGDVGECRPGVQHCDGGGWGGCEGAVDPVEERCDGLDDDCDGIVDESLGSACGTDEGECRAGFQSCVDGQWGGCDGEITPAGEACNGLDDDCDQRVDEDFDLSSTFEHCGGCNQGCEPGAADRCDSGQCRCGGDIPCDLPSGQVCVDGYCQWIFIP